MSSRKSYPGLGGHSVTRSEFEDGVLRDNARHGNRLDNEKRYVDKAKKVVVRGYDKESQMLKQKMATNAQRKTTSYFSQAPSSNGMSAKPSTSKSSTGRSARLIPDYEYKQYKARQKAEEGKKEENGHTTTETVEVKPQPEAKPVALEQHSEPEAVDGQLPVNGKFDDLDEGHDVYVSSKRGRTTEQFWNNLSAPKNQSNVRQVRERLRQEFGPPKSAQKNGTSPISSVHGTRLVRK